MAMNTLVQVSVIDSSTQQQQHQSKSIESTKSGSNHHHQYQARRQSSDEGGGPLPDNWDLSFSDNSLLSVYCFVKNFIGAASTGASTVAIDNKIEQAMDLVKSHLMFAVREEVEVLKEKITELLERISQLEHENDILRANASPETLKQLNQSQKKFTGHSVIGTNQQTVNTHGQNQPPSS